MAQVETLGSNSNRVPRWDILGIPVLAGHASDVTHELDSRLTDGERIKLTYLNAHASNVAAGHPEFSTALKSFSVLNDGVGLEDAAAALAQALPQHEIVGARDGYFVATGSSEIAAHIKASGADLLLVAMGNPAQELWIDRNFEATGARLAIGVGALFDFLAARVPRAPKAVRNLRLEWAFRLALEPNRLWRRYLVGNPLFLARVARALPRRGAPN